MVRELDVSKITLRLTEKTDNKGNDEHDNVIAKLTGQTLPTIQQCLVSITPSQGFDMNLNHLSINPPNSPFVGAMEPRARSP